MKLSAKFNDARRRMVYLSYFMEEGERIAQRYHLESNSETTWNRRVVYTLTLKPDKSLIPICPKL